MHKKFVITLAAAAAGAAMLVVAGQASSHREAPLISMDPMADNTDLYAFRSPDRPDTVTIIANYIPLESPAGGPNFPAFDDAVLYEIHIDNDGDAKDDLTYQFRFDTDTRNPDTFLYNTGPILSNTDPNWNRPQTYSVKLVKEGQGRSDDRTLGAHLTTPPDNIGPRSTPNYRRWRPRPSIRCPAAPRCSRDSATTRSSSIWDRSSTSRGCGRSIRFT